MESGSVPAYPAIGPEIRTAMLQWIRFTSQLMADAVNTSKPLFDAYFQGIEKVMPDIRKLSRQYCEIPESKCPPYCICEMEWDACQGDSLEGSIEIRNTGEQAINFVLNTENFRSSLGDSGIGPSLSQANFVLKQGESKTVLVNISLDGDFDPRDVYESQIKLTGRYEQCIRLRLQVRRRQTPRCEIEHGEIPTRIVSHNWYDHFQCEELCFKPVTRVSIGTITRGDDVTGRPAKKRARTTARRSKKKASKS